MVKSDNLNGFQALTIKRCCLWKWIVLKKPWRWLDSYRDIELGIGMQGYHSQGPKLIKFTLYQID